MIDQYTPGTVVPFQTAFVLQGVPTNTDTTPHVLLTPPTGSPITIALTSISGAPGEYQTTYTLPSNAALGVWGYIFQGTLSGQPQSGGFGIFNVVVTITVLDLGGGYCTINDVRYRLPRVSSNQSTNGGIPDASIQGIIMSQSSQIDAKLYNRYSLNIPFSPVPDLIRSICADWSAALVIDSIYTGGGENKDTPRSSRLEKRALNMLSELQTGKAFIPGMDQNSDFNMNSDNIYGGPFDTPVQRIKYWEITAPLGHDRDSVLENGYGFGIYPPQW